LPFVANPQPALFYPTTWLALAMPVTRALSVAIVLHVWLAGVGMLAWLREEGCSLDASLLGALTFAFGGYFFARVQAGHLGVIATGAWLPLLLALYRRSLTRRSYRLALVGGLSVGLALLAGHTASFFYVGLALVAYTGFRAWEARREVRAARRLIRPLMTLGLMLGLGLAVAAVQLLPLAELAARSARQAGASYEFAARFPWPPGYLLTLLVPNFFGEPVRTGYWGEGVYDEVILYVGVLPLLLTLVALRLRQRLVPFLAGLGLGGLLLAFGEYGILHRLFFRFVPGFSLTRAPARAGFLFALAAAAACALAADALQAATSTERRRLLSPLRPAVVAIVAGVTLTLLVCLFGAFALHRDTNPDAGRLYHLANQGALFLLFFLLSAALLGAWRDAQRVPRSWLWLAGGLILLDLWGYGSRIVTVKPVAPSAVWATVAGAVSKPAAARVLPWGLNDFEQNGGMPFRLRSVFGYDPLILQRFEEFVSSRPDPRARTYDLLNAGYLVAVAPQEFPDEPDAPRLVVEANGVWVYERPSALPRAWVAAQSEVLPSGEMLARIHDPQFEPRRTALVERPLDCAPREGGAGGEAEILLYGASRIVARTGGGGGVLVFSEVDYPGWRASVDGVPAELVRADYLLRALCVPAGEHVVTLVYDPPLLKVGLGISAVALTGVLLAAAWPLLGRRRDAGGAE
jgi:hypothetical protein